MEIRRKTSKLERLYNDGKDIKESPGIVARFIKAVNFMKACISLNDMYAMKSLHCEKLKGKYSGKMSIRLNLSRRLIFSVTKQGEVQVIAIEELSNHYG